MTRFGDRVFVRYAQQDAMCIMVGFGRVSMKIFTDERIDSKADDPFLAV